ncbi:glycosyltransferase family 4 protein [Candidatus Omnitrophota bacterium]
MRVCMVGLDTLPLPPVKGGAIERIMQETAIHLVGAGIELHIISIGDREAQEEALKRDDGINYHFVDIPKIIGSYPVDRLAKGLFYYKRVGKLIKDIGPNIVHYQNQPAAVFCASRSYNNGTKNVLHLHNMDYGWNFMAKRVDKFLFKKGFDRVDSIITCSDFIKNHALENYSCIPTDNISTLYNGVDTDVFKPSDKEVARREYGFEDGPIILFAGRIDPRKGVHILLDAFEKVHNEISDAQLAIIGPMGSYWHKEPQEYALKIKKQVGQMKNVYLFEPEYGSKKLAQFFSIADVGCMPSVFPEGLNITSLEMQSCGLPVVVTNAGGLPETIIKGKTGLLIEQNNTEALAKSILSLIKNETLRADMSKNAREHIVENFSWDVIVGKLVEVYKDVIYSRPEAAPTLREAVSTK